MQLAEAYYDDMEDEIQDEYSPVQFEQSAATIAGGIDPDGHLQAEELWGVQTKLFDITTPEGCTLEQLASSAKNGLFWEIPEEMKPYLKQVAKSQNRSAASKDDLDGDLNKALFLGAEVVSYYSDCPKRLAVDIPGLVPMVHTSTGRHNFVIPSTRGQVVPVGRSIFDADNIFTRHMYEKEQKCDIETLNQDIRFDVDPTKQFAVFNTHGIGWKVLMNNINSPSCPEILANAYDAIAAKNEHIMGGDTQSPQLAQVPYKVGELIYNSIAEPLREIEKSYVDLENWKVKFSPANKEPWNSVNGLVKDATAYGTDAAQDEVESKTCTPFQAGILIAMRYVTKSDKKTVQQ